MIVHAPLRRLAAAITLAAASLTLTGCLFQPGSFEATMNVRENGAFSFTYEGEIVMAGIAQLSQMADEAEADGPPAPCVDDTTLEDRPCTEAELAERAAEKQQGQEMMRKMAGGIDLSDAETMAQFASAIERQAGWNSVEPVDEGVFQVSFAITSRLGHDFDFPTFEEMPMGNAFVQARLRDEGRLRVTAPGFAAQGGGNPFAGMMMMGMMGAMADSGAEDGAAPPPALRPISGTFRIITDAPILANNTDEGPTQSGADQILSWDISSETTSAPMALLKLTP